MAPPAVQGDMSCKLCFSQIVNLYPISVSTCHPASDSIKHWLFHEPCDKCDGANFNSLVSLCDLCQHLRVHHIIRCCPAELVRPGAGHILGDYDMLSLATTPLREESRQCDFCVFVAAHSKEDIEREISNIQKKQDVMWEMKIWPHRSCTLSFPDRFYGWDLHARPGGDKWSVEPYIDWSWLRNWVAYDTGTNKSSCTKLSLQQELEEVRVIDVARLCVVKLPPRTTYVALSYLWGVGSGSVFRCERSNVQLLEQPGSLGNKNLPGTISDAISVCVELGHQFLWVDRLCIIQDDEDISVHLEQMAAIYHQAILTLVAIEGTGATHGLPGVSYPRDAKQSIIEYNDLLTLVDGTPSLDSCLSESKWHERGWTYQEYVASSRLLFFTDHGLYLLHGIGKTGSIQTEGPAKSSRRIGEEQPGLDMVVKYTERTLTYSSDRLRAISGILQALYGDRTYHGMPLDDFDRAILWFPSPRYPPQKSMTTAMFPTWSWTSSNSKIRFGADPLKDSYVCSLAYWGKGVAIQGTEFSSFQWLPISRPHEYDERINTKRQWDLQLKTHAALAWLHGCVDSKAPEWLLVDCSREEYTKRLNEKWTDESGAPWNDVFCNYKDMRLFESAELRSLSTPGRLITYTTKAAFAVDWITLHAHSDNHSTATGIVRTKDCRIAGFAELDDDSSSKGCNQTYEFIALSVYIGVFSAIDPLRSFVEGFSTSALYGCPCSSDTSELNHIVECSRHPDFWGDVYREDVHRYEIYYRALQHHRRELSYHDTNGKLLNDDTRIPQLWVMIIAPSLKPSDGGKVYRRLGLGVVALKRWVEAEPVFSTVVLE